MRLRLREASSGRRTWRVEVAQGTPTLRDLLSEITQMLSSAVQNAEEPFPNIVLSLNKKDPLHSDEDATLSSLGICNGDLVWLMSPSALPTSASFEKEKEAASFLPAVPCLTQPHQPSSPASAAAQADPMEVDCDDENTALDHIPVPVGLRVPGHLLRVLSANPNIATSIPGLVFLTAHAAMLETGFAVYNDTEDASMDSCALSEGCTVCPGLYRLQYSLKTSMWNGRDHGREGPCLLACTLTCSTMGNSVMVAAATADGMHVRHVVLDWNTTKPGEHQWIVPVISSASTSLASSSAAAGSAVQQEESLELCPHVTVTAGQRIVVHGQWVMDWRAMRALWNSLLKDKVALPAVAAACEAAGLLPPAGLISLPVEVKDTILHLLSALDLAALGAICSEMRHLTVTDDLWRPLFLADFQSPPRDIAEAASRRGYKWAYGQSYAARKRAQEDASRRRQRRYFIPGIPHHGPAPFYPAPPPRGFPGIIGGDHDRLPFLGGGGVMGGGGGVFGTHTSTRRQGHGGGPRWI